MCGQLLLLALIISSAAAQLCYIDAVSGSDSTGNGTSTNPWASFSMAVNSGCLQVNVRPGTYTGGSNRGLMLTAATSFMGTGGVNIENDGPDEGAIVDLQGAARFLSTTAPLMLSRLTIRGGRESVLGGAIDASTTSLQLSLCSIYNNSISGADVASGTLQGGAIAAANISADFCSFRNNSIVRGSSGSITVLGGAVSAETANLRNCSFRFNSIVTSGSGSSVAQGGALAINKMDTAGELLLQQTLFYRNHVIGSGTGPHYGGALYVSNFVDSPNRTPLAIVSCSFLRNSVGAFSGTHSGGALYADEAAIDPLRDSLFYGNSAPDDGGALYINQVSVDRPSGITGDGSNSFVNNTSGGSGGAIFDLGSQGINFSPAALFQCNSVPMIFSVSGCTGCTSLTATDSDADGVCDSGDCAPLNAALQVNDVSGDCIAIAQLNSETGLSAIVLVGKLLSSFSPSPLSLSYTPSTAGSILQKSGAIY